MSNNKSINQELVQLYKSDDGQVQLNVTLDGDTTWLTQVQMSELFGKNIRTISEHINNIFKEGELQKDSVIRKFRRTAKDGKIYNVNEYNLDVLISVGYRVKSVRGVQFRQWATKLLKHYFVQGHVLNETRLREQGIEFEQVIDLLSKTLINQKLIEPPAEAVLNVIQYYARSWSLLQAYDEQNLVEQSATQHNMQSIAYKDVLLGISQLKQELIQKGQATKLFAQLKDNGLESAIATIEQGYGEELFYPNVASRAANLLYFIIKNHAFTDGNKRTASFVFLWYLRINQQLLATPVENMINNNTMVALTLLIAESAPKQKKMMIRLIENFIHLTKEN